METQIGAAIVGGVIAIAGGAASYLYRIRHERTVLNKAILAEVNRLLFVIERHEKWLQELWPNDYENGDYPPLIPFSTDVYRGQNKNIGVVDEAIIVRVVKFYGYVEYLNALQTLRSKYPSVAAFNEQYHSSVKTLLKDYEKAFVAAFKKYEVNSV